MSKFVLVKNGLDLTRLIINPLVEKVIEMLREYVDDCHEFIKDHKEFDDDIEMITRYKLKQMERANVVIMNIKLVKMTGNILKYIAPHFGLKLNDSDSENSSDDN